MIVAYTFIQRTKPGITYTNDARILSSNVTCHHGPQAQEPLVGNKWWEAGYTHKPQAYKGHPMKQKKLITQAKQQRAACDTLPQAVQHDLMMTTLFKRTIHG